MTRHRNGMRGFRLRRGGLATCPSREERRAPCRVRRRPPSRRHVPSRGNRGKTGDYAACAPGRSVFQLRQMGAGKIQACVQLQRGA